MSLNPTCHVCGSKAVTRDGGGAVCFDHFAATVGGPERALGLLKG